MEKEYNCSEGKEISAEGSLTPQTRRKLRLDTLQNSRKSLARIMRSYYRGTTSEAELRALVYAFSTLLHYFKTEGEFDVLDRIARIEISLGLRGEDEI